MYRENPKSKIRQYLEKQLTKYGEDYIKRLEVQVESIAKHASTLESLAQSGIPIEKQSLELVLKEVKEIKKDLKPSKDKFSNGFHRALIIAGSLVGSISYTAYLDRSEQINQKKNTYESQLCESSNDYELTNDPTEMVDQFNHIINDSIDGLLDECIASKSQRR